MHLYGLDPLFFTIIYTIIVNTIFNIDKVTKMSFKDRYRYLYYRLNNKDTISKN